MPTIALRNPLIILAPQPALNKLPKNEHPYAHAIHNLLRVIGHRVLEFGAAVELAEYCREFLERTQNFMENNEEYRRRWLWRAMAAREAAATVYRVHEEMEVVANNLTRCPTLGGMVDRESKKEAMRLFKRHFPGFEGMRHSGQHFAKLYGSPEKLAQHVSPELPLVIVNAITGSTVQTIFEGQTVTLDLTEQSLSNLAEVRDMYWQAWMPTQQMAQPR